MELLPFPLRVTCWTFGGLLLFIFLAPAVVHCMWQILSLHTGHFLAHFLSFSLFLPFTLSFFLSLLPSRWFFCFYSKSSCYTACDLKQEHSKKSETSQLTVPGCFLALSSFSSYKSLLGGGSEVRPKAKVDSPQNIYTKQCPCMVWWFTHKG